MRRKILQAAVLTVAGAVIAVTGVFAVQDAARTMSQPRTGEYGLQPEAPLVAEEILTSECEEPSTAGFFALRLEALRIGALARSGPAPLDVDWAEARLEDEESWMEILDRAEIIAGHARDGMSDQASLTPTEHYLISSTLLHAELIWTHAQAALGALEAGDEEGVAAGIADRRAEVARIASMIDEQLAPETACSERLTRAGR